MVPHAAMRSLAMHKSPEVFPLMLKALEKPGISPTLYKSIADYHNKAAVTGLVKRLAMVEPTDKVRIDVSAIDFQLRRLFRGLDAKLVGPMPEAKVEPKAEAWGAFWKRVEPLLDDNLKPLPATTQEVETPAP
jgi:hypothetical protein